MRKLGGILGACVLGLGMLAASLALTGMDDPSPIVVLEQADPMLAFDSGIAFEGKASWYGPGFHGRLTASGEVYDRFALTAAHRTLRHGSMVRVTNLRTDQSALLVINDWGPVPADRVIDVSEAAADLLGFHHQGIARVRVEVLRASLD